MRPADDGRYFIKSGPAADQARFEAEVDGLAALAATGAVRLPTVIDCGSDDESAWLVLERLELSPLDRTAGALLGRQLAQLHRTSEEHFGWRRDNFIGSTPQENAPLAVWPLFFAQRRLQPQLARAKARGMPREVLSQGEYLVERIAAFFLAGHPQPSLLHGDLWSGNAGRMPDGTPAMFDPAVHYGDREADLAMAELFGGFPESFYAAYREAWPLAEGFATRKELYNLYHILNHYNMFGDAYLGQARRMLGRLVAELRA